MRGLAGLAVLLAALAPCAARAVTVDALDLGVDWQLRALKLRGNHAVSSRAIKHALVTKPRTWFALWRHRPTFDPTAFTTDLERLHRLYRSRGFYHARIDHDLETDPEDRTLVAVLVIDEGVAVHVQHLEVDLGGEPLGDAEREALLAKLPIHEGDRFTEEAYGKGLTYLRAYYREHGHARVQVEKHAQIDPARNSATVRYEVDSGPTAVFGTTTITGTKKVDPEIIRRELVFEPGDPFTQSRIDRTRKNLANLTLFRVIRIEEDPSRNPTVDMTVHVDEAPPREIRLGIGYDTEEQVRGLAAWRHYNFLGGARQLGFTARASLIERAATADFLQPHFPGADNRVRLLFTLAQDEEDTYTLERISLSPRFEWQATQRVTGFVFHRSEYDSLSSVKEAVRRALPGGAPANVFLSGIGVGADWNETDDLLDPTRGFVVTGTVEPVGGVLGGDVSFVRGVVEGRFYQPLVAQLGGAFRLKLGTAEVLDGTGEVPLYERFYAGGLNSVRGYGRRRVGPLVDDEPIGGRTLVETSFELRHPITETIGAAVFLDAGQVDLRTADFPFDDLRYGAGVGVRYKSPVGPLRVDLAFPNDPPGDDAHWQVHLSLGGAF
jgi:outer membrane protein assembly complex protein YaeT